MCGKTLLFIASCWVLFSTPVHADLGNLLLDLDALGESIGDGDTAGTRAILVNMIRKLDEMEDRTIKETDTDAIEEMSEDNNDEEAFVENVNPEDDTVTSSYYTRARIAEQTREFIDGMYDMVSTVVVTTWPEFASKFKGMDLDMAYERIRITDSVIVRYIRDSLTGKYSIAAENWYYFEMALLLLVFGFVMQISLIGVTFGLMSLFLLGDAMVWIFLLAFSFKMIYRIFKDNDSVEAYYENYNEKHDGTSVGLTYYALMVALVVAGLITAKVLPIHIVWMAVLVCMVILLLIMFPAVVQKSATDGMGLAVIVTLLIGVVTMATVQLDAARWWTEMGLHWKYPHADLTKYVQGLETVDDANMARHISKRASEIEPQFLDGVNPMSWTDALRTRVTTSPYVEESRSVYGGESEYIPYWILTTKQTTNMTMIFVTVVGMMCLFLLAPMGSALAIEGERREQNMQARARDGGMRIDKAPTFWARLMMCLSGTFPMMMMGIEYFFIQWIFGKIYLSLSLILIVPIGVLVATYVIECSTGDSWMDIGGAAHRGIRNVAGGIAFLSPAVLKPFEKSMETFMRMVVIIATLVSCVLSWESGGWIAVAFGAVCGSLAVAHIDVGLTRTRKQLWVLIFMSLVFQFYGTAFMLIVLKCNGRIVTFFRHDLHNAGNPLQMGE